MPRLPGCHGRSRLRRLSIRPGTGFITPEIRHPPPAPPTDFRRSRPQTSQISGVVPWASQLRPAARVCPGSPVATPEIRTRRPHLPRISAGRGRKRRESPELCPGRAATAGGPGMPRLPGCRGRSRLRRLSIRPGRVHNSGDPTPAARTAHGFPPVAAANVENLRSYAPGEQPRQAATGRGGRPAGAVATVARSLAGAVMTPPAGHNSGDSAPAAAAPVEFRRWWPQAHSNSGVMPRHGDPGASRPRRPPRAGHVGRREADGLSDPTRVSARRRRRPRRPERARRARRRIAATV